MDNYENIKQEIREAYEQALMELFLLKVSGQSADKALERRMQAELDSLQWQLDSLNSTMEDLSYELENLETSVANLGVRTSGTQGVVAEHAQTDDE